MQLVNYVNQTRIAGSQWPGNGDSLAESHYPHGVDIYCPAARQSEPG